jgi:hypothetical protein
MADDFAPPSADPADNDSLAGVMRTAIRKSLQQVNNMLPARVVAYDRNANRATVQPLIHIIATDNTQLPRPQIAQVPVMQMSGGGVVLNFNVKPGDFGWVHANDRDISTFLQGMKEVPPNTLRMHSFEDGVFIPDVMRGWVIAPEDADNTVLQTLDGSVCISLGAGGIKLRKGGKSVTLDDSGTTIVGGLTVDGIVFSTHKHTGVVPGGGSSGGPTN